MTQYLRQYVTFKHIFEIELQHFVKQCEIDEEFDFVRFKDFIYEIM